MTQTMAAKGPTGATGVFQSNIWTALLAVQAEAPALQRDGLNPHFKSEYVTLETLMETVLPILNRHGVVLVQAPGIGEGHEDVLFTKLIHAASGDSAESEIRLYLGKEDAQALGSALTYARRYALMAMLGLVADSDDDGNAAAQPKRGNGRKASPQARQQEFDPARQLMEHAIAVKGEDDVNALRLAQRDLDPKQDWTAIEQSLMDAVFAGSLDSPAEWGQWWKRLANAVARAWSHGDLVSHEEIQEAYAWAFDGAVIALSAPVTAEEDEVQSTTQGEEEPRESAADA